MYKSILKEGRGEYVIKKSTFIAHSKPVETEEEAQEFIDRINSEYKDATHNCWAYIIGEDFLKQRYSDDGEPSGTAGVPMLEVLKKNEVTNVVVVVTRYFGGILLGGGGLLRAYTQGAILGLEEGKIVSMMPYYRLRITYDYTYHGTIMNYLQNEGYKILLEDYTDRVALEVHEDIEKFEKFKQVLLDFTGANIDIEILEECILPTDGSIIYGEDL